jgi:CubicO group peptidase (beta-lactamase class C family)
LTRRRSLSNTHKQFKEFKTIAFLVIKDQKIQFEKYWEDFSPDTRSGSCTMAASIVSLLIGIALDEGNISSIDQPVGEYLHEFSEGDKAKITIRHLLEMSSGLSWIEDYTSFFSMPSKAYYGNDLPALVLDQTVVREPGVFFEYQSGNTQLLAMILERAIHQKVSPFASEKLWKPLGAGADALWSLDQPNGIEKAFCCFYAGARDFARFGQLILNRGKWNGKQVVSSAYLEQALAPSDHLADVDGKNAGFYGWHWWITDYQGHKVYYMKGMTGQYVIAIPDLNTVIVRLGEEVSTEKIAGIPADFYTWMDAGIELSGR